ncbi:Acyl-coenzyme A thioesterase PaaI, contains HGG motif [Pseudoxanthomonas sp. GM95]|uniref:hotdog fold domain-containing protein n=1 Tax=Pseudoxanthomonas sp. GM95 TaxID=1881043 RepID=UPI0008C3B10A|nr:hotdog fold domain-containing protein [Pseudoxanthomonas sp. GM95]SEL69442.1 Acyl-coenzyme A thioesterase PaaI, contains HGG motif [Pseudoxanthomonas sp. GM95]
MAAPILSLYRRLQRWPAGNWLFSRAVCFKAPYFASIAPRITRLDNGCCEARIADRRRVHNHIGTVHAIALCNLAELTAGLMTDASLPASMRWIPKGMSVQYLKKAVGTLHAVATPAAPLKESGAGYALQVDVAVRDGDGDTVFTAQVEMWVSPKPARHAVV